MHTPSALVTLCLVGLLCGSPVVAQENARATELSRFNGTYRDLASNLAPVRQGGLDIHISSPRHRLTIHSNRVELTPTGRGTFDLVYEAEFDGDGDLIADVVAPGGSSTQFTDKVSASRQQARATGEVALAAHERGFLITVVKPGPPAQVVIESGLVRQVEGLCGVFALLPLMKIDCEALGDAMGRIRVPLPEPGEEFVLPAEYLTEEEQAFFERLLSGPSPRSPAT